MAKNTLEIVVKAKDDASRLLKNVSQALEDAGKAASSSGKLGQFALGGISMGAAAAAAGIGVLSQALTKVAFEVISWPADIARGLSAMVLAAAPLQGIQAAYEGITGGGEAMLAQLREQSSFMIADRDLMKSYNLAAQLVSKTFADQLPEAMKYMTKVAAATGQSMDYMMNSWVVGTGRLSVRILDNLAIQVDLEAANETYAKSVGKTVDQLTVAEQQIAVTNEGMKQLAKNTANMPEVLGSASQGLAAISAWFQNTKDVIGMAFIPALQNVLDMFGMLSPLISETMLPVLRSLGGWVEDLTREWTHGFASLIAQAANWGANIVESLAAGISGSGAISGALRNVANTITAWLMPGSAPKLLPDLPEWGAGALDAWLGGWTPDAAAGSMFLQNLRGNLKPFLEAIDLGKGIDEGALRDVFGGDTPSTRRYLRAYEGVGLAVRDVKEAREALTAAEESGDEDAIKTAKERVGEAEQSEYSARRTFNAEERRMEQRISAEAQLTRAIIETARVQTKAATDAAQLAEEAKQRAIALAHLQYRLAVAGTPLAQIPIWEEQLAKAEEGSAEWWQIQTRLVELRRAAAKGAGESIGAAMGDGLDEGMTAAAGKAGGGLVTGIDWGGIGRAIGGAILDGIVVGLTGITNKITAWATDPDTLKGAWDAGGSLGTAVGNGIRALFGLPAETDATAGALEAHMQAAVWKAGPALARLAIEFSDAFIWSVAASLMPGDVTGVQLAAGWESFLSGMAPGAALWAKGFDYEEGAVEVAQGWQKIAEDPRVADAVREMAAETAQWWIDEYGLKVDAEFGVLTAEMFNQLALSRGVLGAADFAGAAAGTAMGAAAGVALTAAMQRALDASLPGLNYNYVLPEPDYGPPTTTRGKPGFAEGGIVTRPTLAWIGEAGPELIMPLPQGLSGLSRERQTPAWEDASRGATYITYLNIDAPGANAKEVEIGVLRGLRGAGIPAGY